MPANILPMIPYSAVKPLVRAQAGTFLLLTPLQWGIALGVSSVLAALCWPWYNQISLWVGGTLFTIGIVVVHLSFTARVIVVLPHIAVLIAGLQYVLAAWLSYYYPPNDPVCVIGDRLPLYLSYAAPALIASTLGWFVAFIGLRPHKAEPMRYSRQLLVELDVIFVIGMVGLIVGQFIYVPSLAFVLVLISNLRYVGVYGRMLTRGPGWGWRLLIIVFFELSGAAYSTMFHDLLLWSCWTAAIWIYRYSPRRWIIVGAITVGFISLPALQASKWQMRNAYLDRNILEDEDPLSQGTRVGRTEQWLSYMGSNFYRTVTFNLSDDFMADMLSRYNQGWIVNRVMLNVPAFEPYAGGSTLKEAVMAALLPRVFATSKMTAGGQEHMFRYAAIELNEGTSMTLGYSGEMYANFGLNGGIVACGLYALTFSLIFRFICRRGFKQPFWWCVVPYIFYVVLKAEDDVGMVLNWTVKSCIFMGCVLIFFPHFRQTLLGSSLRGKAALSRPRATSVLLISRCTAGER